MIYLLFLVVDFFLLFFVFLFFFVLFPFTICVIFLIILPDFSKVFSVAVDVEAIVNTTKSLAPLLTRPTVRMLFPTT